MAVYNFCNKTLTLTKINTLKIINIFMLIILIIFLFFYFGYKIGLNQKFKNINLNHEQLIIILNENENESFTPQLLYDYLIELNVKFPDIVFAQACLETGFFKSNIFKINHNLFGMKEATKRIKISKGTELGHAYYDNWKESVIDYAFYQATYLSDIKTETQYLEFLDKNYAESQDYKNSIIRIIKNNPLKIKK